MEEKKRPTYLYHYTNIESLALILANKTIRFSPLTKMDDLQEKEAADLKNAGQYIYVSSWTADEAESIPMWNMYASLKSGIRIRMKANPFQAHNNTADELRNVTQMPVNDSTRGKGLTSYIPITEMFQNGFIWPMALGNPDFLFEIQYTDDKSKLYPKLTAINDDSVTVELMKLGQYKNKSWDFQKEWRYILLLLPLSLNQNLEEITTQAGFLTNQIINDKKDYNILPYYDMRIDEEEYRNMEITLSPQISSGNRILLDALFEKYNPNIRVYESSLHGLL